MASCDYYLTSGICLPLPLVNRDKAGPCMYACANDFTRRSLLHPDTVTPDRIRIRLFLPRLLAYAPRPCKKFLLMSRSHAR